METLIGRLAGPDIQFLTPFVPEDGSDAAPSESGSVANSETSSVAGSVTGKFPDRFVAQSDQLSPDALFERIGRADRETREIFAGYLGEIAGREISDFGGAEIDASPEAVSALLDGYLQTRFFALPAEQADMSQPVKAADEWLSTLEESLRFDTGRGRDTCGRCKTLPGAVRVREIIGEGDGRRERRVSMCALCLAKFRANRIEPLLARMPGDRVAPDRRGRGRMNFPTLQEIAAREIYEDHREEIQAAAETGGDGADLPFSEIERIIGRPIPAAFRYVAVVQADGDRVGKLAGALRNPRELSERFFAFAEAAERKVEEFGGVPIFIGGDDLLAFLPVFYRGRTVIDFAEAVAREYREIVNRDLPENVPPSTLSLGINVAYYKFPLSTARAEAESLLFGAAKATRDTAALRLTRHAGSQVGVNLRLGQEAFPLFQKLLRDVLSARMGEEAGAESPEGPSGSGLRIPGGLFYNLGRFRAVLAALPDAGRLEAFFDNNFNEGEHVRFESGLARVRALFAHYLFGRTPVPGAVSPPAASPRRPETEAQADSNPGQAEAVEEVLSMLKFIKFLTGEEER